MESFYNVKYKCWTTIIDYLHIFTVCLIPRIFIIEVNVCNTLVENIILNNISYLTCLFSRSYSHSKTHITCVIDLYARADTVMAPLHYSDNLLGCDDSAVR